MAWYAGALAAGIAYEVTVTVATATVQWFITAPTDFYYPVPRADLQQ